MAAWLESVARVEAPAPRKGRPNAKPKPKPKARAHARPAMLGGVVWIAVLAVLLGGIVALNVAVLQMNLRLDELAREKVDLRSTNAALSAQLSSSDALPQIQRLATTKLGLEPAKPEQTTYVQLEPK